MSSQASKHIEWCVKKAEKELEECKKQKKKLRHRGLRKVTSNRKDAIAHLDKARHMLEGFQLLRKNGFSDLAVGAGFYAMYHCFLGIAVKYGYESKNQTCTIALIEALQEGGKIDLKKEIVDFMKYEEEKNTHEDSVIELREDYTYGVELQVKDEDQLNTIEKLCIELLEVTRSILYS